MQDGTSPSSPSVGLVQYDQALESLRRSEQDHPEVPDESTMQAIGRIGAIYRQLNHTDQLEAMRHTPTELRELVNIGVMVAEKDEIISAGWSQSRDYYTRLCDAIRAATPPDGQDHCFSVVIGTDRVQLTPIPEIPEDRGASTSTVAARVVDGALTAGYVFSDMGHAGVWGILFSDADLPIDTTSYTGGPSYWMFTDVGKPLFPHIYQAWNNID